MVCGAENDLQFDHIDPSTKSFDISVGIRDGYSYSRIEVELAKCQLLCRPHHRVKTRLGGENPGGQNRIDNPDHGTAARYGGYLRCRCDMCRRWKVLYRAKLVDSLGRVRVAQLEEHDVANVEVTGSRLVTHSVTDPEASGSRL